MLFAVLFSATSLSVFAQEKPSRDLTAEHKEQAVMELAKMLRERYVLAEEAERAAALLEKKLADGKYESLSAAKDFADVLTADLQSEMNDKHIRVGEAPVPSAERAPPVDRAARRKAYEARVRRSNYGFHRAEILTGNVGYLDFRRFYPPSMAGDTLVTTMGFFANVDAFILDLRNCHGGSAFLVPYLAAYFVSRPTHLWDMVFRGDGITENYWTFQYVPGKRLADVPLFILTSAYTFSGAEGFAYRFQVIERATIVGERTSGGANAGGAKDVAPFFRVYMPMGRPVDRDTGTNWEGTGVEPDIVASANDALGVAHLAALEALKEKATETADPRLLDWAIRRVMAERNPPTLSIAELERFVGTYGPGRVWVEGGQLRYKHELNEPLLLKPLSDTVFFSPAEDPTHIEFVLLPDGDVDGLVFVYRDGYREELKRESS
jgi:hypothetical protein